MKIKTDYATPRDRVGITLRQFFRRPMATMIYRVAGIIPLALRKQAS